MRRPFFYSVILLAIACQGGPDGAPAPGTVVQDPGEAKQLLKPGEPVVSEGYREVYVEIGRLTVRNIDFSFQSRFKMPVSLETGRSDSAEYHDNSYLIVRDRAA